MFSLSVATTRTLGCLGPTRASAGSRGRGQRRASAAASTREKYNPRASCQLDAESDEVHHPAKKLVASCLLATTLFTTGAPTAVAIDLVMADPSVKQYMDSRDEAMKMKCQNMMDCNGDRREYAKSENFIRRNSGDEFIPPECRVEEACTTDIIGAAIAGVSGLTTSEKLEKMGKDGGAVNGTDMYFGK